MSSIINEAVFVEHYHKVLNAAMKEAAEPVIKAALKEIEHTMRKDLAKNLIAIMDSTITMDTFGTDLRILIRREGK